MLEFLKPKKAVCWGFIITYTYSLGDLSFFTIPYKCVWVGCELMVVYHWDTCECPNSNPGVTEVGNNGQYNDTSECGPLYISRDGLALLNNAKNTQYMNVKSLFDSLNFDLCAMIFSGTIARVRFFFWENLRNFFLVLLWIGVMFH